MGSVVGWGLADRHLSLDFVALEEPLGPGGVSLIPTDGCLCLEEPQCWRSVLESKVTLRLGQWRLLDVSERSYKSSVFAVLKEEGTGWVNFGLMNLVLPMVPK